MTNASRQTPKPFGLRSGLESEGGGFSFVTRLLVYSTTFSDSFWTTILENEFKINRSVGCRVRFVICKPGRHLPELHWQFVKK